MPLREDDTIREKLGFVQADVKHVSAQVEKIVGKVDEANTNITKLTSSTVKQSECAQRTNHIAEKLDLIREELAKKQTRPENPAVGFGRVNSGVFQAHDDSTERKKRKPFLVKLKDNLSLTIAIFTLLGLLIAGVVKFAHVIVTIEETLQERDKKDRKEIKKVDDLRSEIKKMRDEQKKVIYVPVYKEPDAGPATKSRRHRRSRRNP